MIELTLSAEIKNRHYDWVFGDNRKKEGRIYQQLKKLKDEETCQYRKKIYEFIFDNLEKLVIGKVEALSQLIDEYEHLKHDISQNVSYNESAFKKIFDKEYNYFGRSPNWNAYEYLRYLDFSVCPYCGTQFTFVFESETGKTRATLDHFFDKATYPYLAISLYNLVPACKVCNSDLKGTKEMNLQEYYSPFEKGIIEDLEIRLEVPQEKQEIETDFYDMLVGRNHEFSIRFHANSCNEVINRKINGNVELFKLEELYNEFHKNYVRSLIQKAHIYNRVYLQHLKDNYGLIFPDREDLRNAVYPSVEDDRFFILGKMTREISKGLLEGD